MPASPPPLAGVRVVDVSTVVAGPLASQVLADYGADVIKVEAPGGDSTRYTGAALEDGMASLFLGSNRNKRSIVLDLKRAEPREALRALIATADVFMHNIRPQKLAGLGLAPEALCAAHPRLIYVGLLGFGEGGPYAGRPAYDDIVQALSGAVDLNRRHMGETRFLPTIVADKVAAQMAAHATLAALYQRERTGIGQVVEVPLFESIVQFLLVEHFSARHLVEAGDAAPKAEELAYARTVSRFRKPFGTRDGYVCFMPYTDRDWAAFFHEVGEEGLAQDPRFGGVGERARNIEALYARLEMLMAGRTTSEWLEAGARLHIACASVNRLEDLESDPHLRAVGMFPQVDAGGWTLRTVRSPVRMAGAPVPPACPPRLGEHSEQILRELGLPDDLVRAVLASG